MKFIEKFNVEVLDLSAHKDSFCRLLLDLHKHYHPCSELGIEGVSLYFDGVMRLNLTKYQVYVCLDGANDIVGFAACNDSISFVELQNEKTIQLQLKELFVRHEYRGKCVGRLLMQRVLEEAKRIGCYRVDWNVRDWNEEGILFYKKLGAEFVEDRLSMRINLSL